jgi:flavin reductase (DIM6/NTAB) family NADH-FMN oxidoreductase RutF
MLSGVAPRPIALVSSMDDAGGVNLSPFSFFNAFGANPPVIVVSPAFRGRDGSPKHTFENIVVTKEFTVSAVTFDMVEQMSLASSDYDRGVDEYVKAGFTKRPSELVSPPGVAESPFIMECRLMQYIDTGSLPSSGNLLVAEVLMFHVSDAVFDGERIDPRKLDLVGRMGYDWYVRANGDALFELAKPRHSGIGIDALPPHLRESRVLTGNELARLGSVEALPDTAAIASAWRRLLRDTTEPVPVSGYGCGLIPDARSALAAAPDLASRSLVLCARALLETGRLEAAWECVLMSAPEHLATVTG